MIHPNYKNRSTAYFTTNSFAYDFCLAELVKPINFQQLQSIDIYADFADLPEQHVSPSTTCSIAGWGPVEHDGGQSPVKRYAEIQVMSTSDCNNAATSISRRINKNYYNRVTGEFSFCGGPVGGNQDTCEGDSGGPLLCNVNGKNVIIGVTSHGPPCGKGNPGIYAKVSKVTPWIKANINCK